MSSLNLWIFRRNVVTTDTLQCRECTHIFLSPTFDREELDRLYSQEACRLTKLQYRESEKVSGKSWAEQNRISPHEQHARLKIAHAERSRRLQQIFQSQNIYPQKICDVGGMDGQIMSQFSDSKRYVYDKVPKKENNFCIYLQSSDDLASNAPYDLIIFSHVLEHVPDPHDFLAPLKQYLSPQGCFYFEVPLQYQGSYLKKRGIPLGCHVNYFTMPSLKQLSVDIGMSHIQFFRKEIVWYDELKVAALKVICKASTMNNKTVFFWPWEIFQDTYLHYKARSK